MKGKGKFLVLAMGLMLLFGVSIAQVGSASASNLLTNGSFETGDLTGWTTSGTQLFYPIAVILTDGVTGSAFGEPIPADTTVGGSPDLAGTHGAYFVDDIANQNLKQSIFLPAGNYQIGFDTYAPRNGFNNTFTATFSGTIANVTLANFDVHLANNPQTWVHYSGNATVPSAGTYDVAFHFVTLGAPAADVVIDRVYIVSGGDGGPTIPTPEPATMLLLGSGILGLAGLRRKFAK